jgi:DNA-binding MarR family transcriptional regulator
MAEDQRTLGTRLRHLIDLLDTGVAEIEDAEGRGFRGRYTPVLKALLDKDGASIAEIAAAAGITHSAASQTVARMVSDGWLSSVAGKDARQRQVAMTEKCRRMVPALRRRWDATNHAAAQLENETGLPLAEAVSAAIEALESQPFSDRIRDALAEEAGASANLKETRP